MLHVPKRLEKSLNTTVIMPQRNSKHCSDHMYVSLSDFRITDDLSLGAMPPGVTHTQGTTTKDLMLCYLLQTYERVREEEKILQKVQLAQCVHTRKKTKNRSETISESDHDADEGGLVSLSCSISPVLIVGAAWALWIRSWDLGTTPQPASITTLGAEAPGRLPNPVGGVIGIKWLGRL